MRWKGAQIWVFECRFEETLIRLRDLNTRARREIVASVHADSEAITENLRVEQQKKVEALQQTIIDLRQSCAEKDRELAGLREKATLLTSEIKLSKSMQQMQVDAAIRSAASKESSGLRDAFAQEKRDMAAGYDDRIKQLQRKCASLEEKLQQVTFEASYNLYVAM